MSSEIKAEPSEDSLIGGINYSELIIDANACLGAGGYGEVHSGYYKSTKVAIKIQTGLSVRNKRSFMREVEVLKSLSHPNIMQYIGSCEHGGGIYIVTELLGENLQDVCINSDPAAAPSLLQGMKYAYDGAVGVRWLHEHQPTPIIHRDIKPENFLLNLDKTHAVVCDFGISQFAAPGLGEKTSGKRRKTPIWSSPEVDNGGLITTKSDVYSFGLFLWSMLTRKTPFYDLTTNEKEIREMKLSQLSFIYDEAYYGDHFNQNIKEKYDVRELIQLIKDCTAVDPAARPDFKAICDRLWDAIIAIAIVDPFSKESVKCTAGGRDREAHRNALRAWWQGSFREEDRRTSLSVHWDTFISKFYELSEISAVPLNVVLLVGEYKETKLKIDCLRALVCEGRSNCVSLDHFSEIACRLGPFDLYAKRYLDRVRELLGFNVFYGDDTDYPRHLRVRGTYLLRFSTSDLIAYTMSYNDVNKITNTRIPGRFEVDAEGRTVFVYCLHGKSESIALLVDSVARSSGLSRCLEYPYEYLFKEKAASKYVDAYSANIFEDENDS